MYKGGIPMRMLELNIQLFAHKKGQSSTSHGRDSAGRRLGAKASDGEFVTAGSILYRQRGTKMFPGENVRRGSDDTLYTTIDGSVKFERLGKDKKQVSVYKIVE
jgi:large subunit ribosomal protein L27